MEGNTMSVEEKLNQANGAIKEGVGKITDDKKLFLNNFMFKILHIIYLYYFNISNPQ